MAHVTADRVLQACTPVGTTSFSLGTAVTGFIGIASIPGIVNNDTAHYSAWGVDADGVPTGEWENGVGTYASGTSSLTRTTVLSSTTGSAITFTASTVWLSVSLLAGRVLQADKYGKYVLNVGSSITAAMNVPDVLTGLSSTNAVDGDVWRSTDNRLWMKAGTEAFQFNPSIVTLGSTISSTSPSLATITGMSIAATSSNAVYEIVAFITFQTAAPTTGAVIGFDGSNASGSYQLDITVPIVSTGGNSSRNIRFPSGSLTNTGFVIGTGVTASNSNHTATVYGFVTLPTIGSTFQLTYATEVSDSQVSIMAGSRMVYRRIA